MRFPEKNITSISDLLKHLKVVRRSYSGYIWYRGQDQTTWKLQPSFFRGSKSVSEATLMTKFKQNASMLVYKSPESYFDWLFQMQHYGVPTRLLDWTESPLTALYFAVNNPKHSKANGALYALLPTELNKYSKIDNSEEEFYIPSFEDKNLTNHRPDIFDQDRVTKLLPLAAIATRNSPRMQAQLGVFTISHRDRTAIEDIETGKHIWKYNIPAKSKPDILEELEVLGINKFQMFPELSSIGEILLKAF